MAIVESVRNYILTCPHVSLFKKINIEFLPEDPNNLSVEEVPTQNGNVLDQFVDGSSYRQFAFVLAARFAFSDALSDSIQNSGFFENFQQWIETQNKLGVYPTLGSGMTPNAIETMTSGYVLYLDESNMTVRCQIQCRLLYTKEA